MFYSKQAPVAHKDPPPPSGSVMEYMDVTLKDLLAGAENATLEAAVLRDQLDKVLTESKAREAQLVTTVNLFKDKYTSVLLEATEKANNILSMAEKNALDISAASEKSAADELKNAEEKSYSIVTNATAQANAILATANEERKTWAAEQDLVAGTQMFEPKIKLDVGGFKFTTSLTTLRRFPDTMLGAMFSGRHALPVDEDGYHFIDRDGTHFGHILNYLRSPETFRGCPLTVEALTQLRWECDFYGLGEPMFPRVIIGLFTAYNVEGTPVVVTQDDEGIYKVRSVAVRVCRHCGVGDYSGNRNGANESNCLIWCFSDVVLGNNGMQFDAQPDVASPCFVCRYITKSILSRMQAMHL